MVVPQAVEQAMHRKQAQLCCAIDVLPARTLHGYRDVSHTTRGPGFLTAGEGEDVRRLAGIQESIVERSKFVVVGHANAHRRPRGDAQLVSARAQQPADACRGHQLALRWSQRVAEDQCDSQSLLTPP